TRARSWKRGSDDRTGSVGPMGPWAGWGWDRWAVSTHPTRPMGLSVPHSGRAGRGHRWRGILTPTVDPTDIVAVTRALVHNDPTTRRQGAAARWLADYPRAPGPPR